MEIKDLELTVDHHWEEKCSKYIYAGEENAQKKLLEFIQPQENEQLINLNNTEKVLSYGEKRDLPSLSHTSRLSPHLHFGEISPRQIWTAVDKLDSPLKIDYLKQIIWREFAHYLLYHFPETVSEPLKANFKKFNWENLAEEKNSKLLNLWKKGLTGFPIVDAGMRELWETGNMHNRVRMIVGSFLVKDLRIHWLEGAKWFDDTLFDADLANNIMGWQWVAGSGADASPYFRIFNPERQSEKFDPDANYIRRWVPELSKLSNKYIHAPEKANPGFLRAANIELGKDYPYPVVDHSLAREIALNEFKNLKIRPLILSLILFHAAIAAISWFIFYLSSKNPELIYHSLKSYFLPLDIGEKLRFIDNPGSHISFKQIKITSLLKIVQELSHWLIILVDLILLYLIFNPKRAIENSINSLKFKEIFIYTAIFSLVGVLSIPNDSSDIYGYIARGAQQVYFNQNPYQSVVASIENWQDYSFFRNMLWENNPAPYGPLFILICKILVSLSFNNFWLAVFLFKLLSSSCFLGTLIFLRKIFMLENLHDREKLFNIFEPSLIIPFIALNPFFFYHSSWNAHNDIVMVFFFIFSFYSLLKKRYNLALISLTASIFIKYIALVLLPLAFIYIWKDFYFIDKSLKVKLSFKSISKYFVPLGTLSSLIISFLLLNHYEFFSSNFSEINHNVTLSHKSLFNSIETIYKAFTSKELPELIKYLFLAIFAGFASLTYIKFWAKSYNSSEEASMEFYDRRNEKLNKDLLKYSSQILGFLILIASPKFHSWYLIIVLVLAFLSYPELGIILSLSHLLSFTFIDQANILNYILMTVLPSSIYFF